MLASVQVSGFWQQADALDLLAELKPYRHRLLNTVSQPSAKQPAISKHVPTRICRQTKDFEACNSEVFQQLLALDGR